MASCSSCSAILNYSSKFCPECGTTVSKSTVYDIPPAATGSEAAQIYDQLLCRIRELHDGESRVNEFKSICKMYGDGRINAETYQQQLNMIVGASVAKELMPDLIRLVSDVKRREQLVKVHSKPVNGATSTDPPAFRNSASFSSGSSSFTSSNGPPPPPPPPPLEKGRSSSVFKGPHNWGNDNKSKEKACSICQKEFHWLRRRHQCRICAGFYCDKDMKFLMIPEGQEHEEAKAFDGNEVTPQRVCLNCAPELEPLQDELCKNSNQHRENAGKFSRVPYMNNNMDMEIAAAARSIQRFFQTGIFYTGAIPDKYIPVKLLREAKGIALFTNYKFGFIVSGAGGTGLAIAKRPDGSWSAPIALAVHSLSVGFKAGVEFAYYLLVIRSDKAVKSLASGSIGLDASADIAIGPFGRAANATAGGGKGGLSTSLMYAHARGLYGGISLGGQMLRVRKDVNRAFYGRDVDPDTLLSENFEPPKAAQPLYDAIDLTFQQARELEREQERREEAKERSSGKIDPKRSSSKKISAVPEAATGTEAATIYEQIISRVEKSGGKSSVMAFKSNCRKYGQGQIDAKQFSDSISKDIGDENLKSLFPDLARLIPDEEKRMNLVKEVDSRESIAEDVGDIVVPSRVTGTEASELHKSILGRVRDATKSDDAVVSFKGNCKSYGNGDMSSEEFYTALYYSLGATECAKIVPDLVRLLPSEENRKDLMYLLNGRSR